MTTDFFIELAWFTIGAHLCEIEGAAEKSTAITLTAPKALEAGEINTP